MIPNYRRDAPDRIDDPLAEVPLSPFPLPTTLQGLMVEVTSPAGGDLLFDSMVGHEGLSSLFEFHARLYSTDSALDLSKLLGEKVAITITLQKTEKKRVFAGIVAKARALPSYIVDASSESGFAYYSVVLRPEFWVATLNKTFRIFSKKTTIEIIETVLQEDNVTFTNNVNAAGKVVREYCVQYNESNYNFVSRLMEEEGIFYFFEFADSGATMILADANKAATDIDPCDMTVVRTNAVNCVTMFNAQNQIIAKDFAAVDFYYMTPGALFKAAESGEGLGGEVYEYPGGYIDSDGASTVGAKRLEEIVWPGKLAFGEGSVLDFAAGAAFAVENHARSDLNQKYLVHSVEHRIAFSAPTTNRNERYLRYTNKFTALPFDVPFAPPRNTPKPKAYGFQTAIVVGPSDKEVHCDEEGRVFVQFNWDREGEYDGANGCPVRCMQGWAGNGFGLAFIPRIGMEALITFENGNPDLPVIIGCLYNGDNKMPAEVPAEPRIMMLKTKTSPEKDENANVMSFDDTDENEKITFKATKDFELSSIANENTFLVKQEGEKTTNQLQIVDGLLETTITKGEKKTTIEEGNYSIALKKGSLTIELEDGDEVITLKKGNYIMNFEDGEMTITAKKDIAITTDAGLTVTAQKDIAFESQASILLTATKDVEITATGEIKITATKNITEKATMDVITEGMNISQKATMDHNIEGLNVNQKAQVAWSGEGLNWGAKATIGATLEGLTVECKGTIEGKYCGLQATLDGSLMSTTQGGMIAALKGGFNMIG
ncbi:MAG: type VI secretion system tip protein VgrG [Holosporales bacterium]|jgi:type VI secretion system secreted protein VgrG|nr:type VI secretion system tip protein VgrG [Holosporales bacterium]